MSCFRLARLKELESLTFGSVGSQNHCFLGPFRIKNLHIIMLIFKQISALLERVLFYFLSFLILFVNKSQQLKTKVKNSKILHVY